MCLDCFALPVSSLATLFAWIDCAVRIEDRANGLSLGRIGTKVLIPFTLQKMVRRCSDVRF